MPDDRLFSNFRLKNFDLRNRIGLAPMTRMSSKADSVPRRDVLDLLVTRARNGAALVYTEAIVTDYESAQGYPGQARLLTQRQINAWKPVVQEIQQEGAAAVMQIFHCGRVSWPGVNPAGRVIAPSPVAPKEENGLTGEPYPVPDAMSMFDIEHVVLGFMETARGAVAAGFNGVELHCAHGYLLSQFLSSTSNQRKDEFGGTLENRFRFIHHVIQAVRRVVPEDRLLTVRISNWSVTDTETPLYESADEWQALVKLLSAEPIDAISVSTYDFSEPAFGTGKTMAKLTREATDLPLMICGRIYDRTTADSAVEEADIVLSGKSMLLNPNWVEEVREGKELRPYTSDESNVAYTDEALP